MYYRELFKIILLLISSPVRAWEEIYIEKDRQKAFSTFVYPMIALCALSVFINSLRKTEWNGAMSFQGAMAECGVVGISLFAGYFLAAFIINRIGIKKI
ncbi:hypothetical protein EZS27_028979 [termite gut metagenome]|uniref:Uncharacterized protein n=1 Tax=termite gut metagenome TaxID=433724 RepID=A0A5J4QKE1_9ZZZZ